MEKSGSISFKRRIYRKICVKFGKFIPDKYYLKMLYMVRIGEKLNLKEPKTFNEKLQWLKLYDRNKRYTQMADKYEVRKLVAEKIGEKYLIPLLGVWESVDEIDFSALPDQFVLKCTHDSASVVICKDIKNFDIEAAKTKLNDALKKNYYMQSREWPYKDIRPRVIAETYMTDESMEELKDYKIYTFGGKPYLIQVDFDRFKNHRRNLYTIDWEYIKEEIEYPCDPKVKIAKPEKLDEMLKLAEILSEGTASLRVDFYSINDKVYFGEITFYQEAGFGRFSSDEFATKLGGLIDLPGRDKKRGK